MTHLDAARAAIRAEQKRAEDAVLLCWQAVLAACEEHRRANMRAFALHRAEMALCEWVDLPPEEYDGCAL